MYSDILEIDGSPLPNIPEEEEAVGIITMEDVIEELLQVLLTTNNLYEQISPTLEIWQKTSLFTCRQFTHMYFSVGGDL